MDSLFAETLEINARLERKLATARREMDELRTDAINLCERIKRLEAYAASVLAEMRARRAGMDQLARPTGDSHGV